MGCVALRPRHPYRSPPTGDDTWQQMASGSAITERESRLCGSHATTGTPRVARKTKQSKTACSIMRLSTWHARHATQHGTHQTTSQSTHNMAHGSQNGPCHSTRYKAQCPCTASQIAYIQHTAQHMAHRTTHGVTWHGMTWYSTQYTTRIIAHTQTVKAMGPPHCLHMCA